MSHKIIFLLKNIILILFILALTYMLPNILNIDVSLNILIILLIVYFAQEIIFLIIKNKELNNSAMRNLLSILLYCYTTLILYHIYQMSSLNDLFKYNYFIIIVTSLSLIVSGFSYIIEKTKEKEK